jgi:uncharacterized membrane protein
MPRDVPSERRSWLLQRRALLQRPQLTVLFATLCCPTLGVAAGFAYLGYWHMLAYALLEMAALAACLWYYGRHLDDYDRIEISESAIVVEQRRGHRRSRYQLNLWTARLLLPARESDAIRFDDCHRQITVGSFLNPSERRHLADELRQCMRVE